MGSIAGLVRMVFLNADSSLTVSLSGSFRTTCNIPSQMTVISPFVDMSQHGTHNNYEVNIEMEHFLLTPLFIGGP